MTLTVLFVFLGPLNARSESLSCDLTLTVIEDSSSSERKNIEFEIVKNLDDKNLMTGALTTISCFNLVREDFQSDQTQVIWNESMAPINGSLSNPNLSIGEHSYMLDMKLARKEAAGNFIAEGFLLSLDDDDFIHQIISGECRFNQILK